jgi:hypothetical protein
LVDKEEAMTYLFRRALVAIVGTLFLGFVAAACSGGSSQAGAAGTVGTSGKGEPAFLRVEVTPSLSVAIENVASSPLLNVSVAIRPASGTILYKTSLPRLEPSEARNLAVGMFLAPDGKSLSGVLAFVRPKEIVVTADDQSGQKHEMTVPWKT